MIATAVAAARKTPKRLVLDALTTRPVRCAPASPMRVIRPWRIASRDGADLRDKADSWTVRAGPTSGLGVRVRSPRSSPRRSSWDAEASWRIDPHVGRDLQSSFGSTEQWSHDAGDLRIAHRCSDGSTNA